MRESFLPYFQPTIGDEEIREVTDSLKSGWLTMGPKTVLFEKAVQTFTGASHAVAVDSCTSALFLSLKAIGIQPGDEVITSPMTFVSTVNVIIHCGAKPVLVDVSHDTLNINPELIERAITPKTKAIIPVHYGGHPADMVAIRAIAQKHNLKIVEDAAHAFGAAIGHEIIGSGPDPVCFSFYAIKNITTGEGGMVTLPSEEMANHLRALRLHGIAKDAWKRYSDKGSWFYEVVEPGFKCNMTDLNASIGLSQLKREREFREKRAEIARYYSQSIDNQLFTLPTVRPGYLSAWHLFPIRINSTKISRGQLIDQLVKMNIGTSVHFIPVHYHPWHKSHLGYSQGDFPIAEKAYEGLISLPLYPAMNQQDARDVVEAIEIALQDA